jgi:predicted  nucleic acid-binding Zn-ribbon protein
MDIKNSESENSGKRWLLMAIIITLLIINVIQLYLQNQSKKEITEKTVIITNKDAELKIYGYKVDSIQHELESRYRELAQLGGDTAAMGAAIRQLKKDKKGLSSSLSAVQGKYNTLKNQYDDIMSTKDKEIETLRDERDNLFRENNDLKRKQVSLNDSVNALKFKGEELTKQVAQAQTLKAANVKVTFIRKDKEIDEVAYKAKKTEKIKVTFDVLENKVAKIESKTFFIRLIEPDGAALYDLSTGGGSFKTTTGGDQYYTAKQEILYEQTNKTMSFIYAKGSAYKVGKHLIEIYCEGNLIGRGGFTLK